MSILGREQESQLLEKVWRADEAQLVAVYGRRRIGKTHLIRSCFAHRGVYFEVMGLKDGHLHEQLEVFTQSFAKVFFQGHPIKPPTSWREAFALLTEQIQKVASQKKVTVFLDELPWLATARSKLLQALDHIWNTQWCKIKNLRVILCGSAASWILDNLINAKGGLHNRITQSLLLHPFNLKQTQDFLESLKFKLSQQQILQIYMVTGGVPYYLKQLERRQSVAQNIQRLCFTEEGLLNKEFDRVFKALFDRSDMHQRIMQIVASNRYGISRDSLLTKLNIQSGGTFKKYLEELEAAGFLKCYVPYGYAKRETYYRVIDEYSLFYLRWIAPKQKASHQYVTNYWQNMMQTPAWKSWAGYAFEGICLKHIDQINQALGLSHIASETGSWRYINKQKSAKTGAQIDLLFDRMDDAITLCEMKYNQKPYVLDKAAAKNIINKMTVFEQQTKTKKQVFVALITASGLKQNIWSEDLIQMEVVLGDLFK